MAKKSVLANIDQAIKAAWVGNISRDYSNFHLFYKEDTLQNSLYYHLRKRLGTRFLEDNALRIYTDFDAWGIEDAQEHADIVIVELAEGADGHSSDSIKSILAVIELKAGITHAEDSHFGEGIDKIKKYIREYGMDSLFYLGFLIERGYDDEDWLDGRQTNNWANGKVAVLSTNRDNERGGLWFHVQSHNRLNEDLDARRKYARPPKAL